MAYELSSDAIDRTSFSVVALDGDSGELAFWLSRTPQERIDHIQRLRQINYGHRASERLQSVFEVAEFVRS